MAFDNIIRVLVRVAGIARAGSRIRDLLFRRVLVEPVSAIGDYAGSLVLKLRGSVSPRGLLLLTDLCMPSGGRTAAFTGGSPGPRPAK